DLWDERYAAQTALTRMGKPATKPLLAALSKASDRARPYLIEALGCTGDWRTPVRLRPFLHSQNALDRGTAVAAIAQLKPAWSRAEFRQMRRGEKDEFVRSRLVEAVGER